MSNSNKRLKQIQNHLKKSPSSSDIGYLTLDNAKKRNALSLEVLQSLRDQLNDFNRSPVDNFARFLPAFDPQLLDELEKAYQRTDSEASKKYGWLIDSDQWNKHREGLPRVIVLQTEGPVFCSGHDLNEVYGMTYDEAQQLFALCAEVMSMIRRCPVPVIGVIQGLATAAGAQLAMTTDLPIAHASTQFRLPGSAMGLGCISPSTAVSRRVGDTFGYRMFALTETFRADALPAGSVEIVDDRKPLEDIVADRISFYTERVASQTQALGKWAYWTQVGFGGKDFGNGYEAATIWTGKAMALFAQMSDSKEGIKAFLTKRRPNWKT